MHSPSKTEKFQRGRGSFSIQKFMLQIFAIIDDTSVMNFRKNCNITFRKWGGGVKGRLELFRKFIRFGRGKFPLSREEKVVVRKSRQTTLSQRWILLVFQIWTFHELKALVVPVQVENMRWWREGEVKRGKLRALICQSDKWRQKSKNDATKL